MFACRPPFSHSGISEVIGHGSLDFIPECFLERTVTVVNEHALTVSGISGEEGAKAEFVWCIKVLEGTHSTQKKRRKLAAFLSRFDQVAPLHRENIDPSAAALLVLLSNLNSQINQRYDDSH